MLRVPSEIKADHFESLKIQETTFVAYRNDFYPAKNDVFFEENAVIYVIEGDKLFTSPEQEVHVKKGDVLFIRRGYYLMSESINESYRSLVFFFEEKLLKEFVGQNLELFTNSNKSLKDQSPILVLKSNETFGKYVESILPYFKSKTNYLNQFLRLKLQEILLHLLEFDSSDQLKVQLLRIYEGQKTDLEYLMNTYYLKPLNTSELAYLSGRSVSAFKRDFSKHFGTAPGIWIKNKKLEHAAFLLKNTQKNVAEVAEIIGYESNSHFIKAFKEKFGHTPKKF